MKALSPNNQPKLVFSLLGASSNVKIPAKIRCDYYTQVAHFTHGLKLVISRDR